MPSAPTKGSAAELEARIDAAEQAVIRRDARVHEQLGILGTHARRLTSPHHWLSAAGGIGALLFGQLLRSRHSDERRHVRADHGAAWSHFIPLLWPLLPRAIRRHASPATWGLALRVVLPVLTAWFGPGKRRSARDADDVRGSAHTRDRSA